jgi:aspartyl-tRNA(Asn)/glutamyl-tRNA(Gln) amidotransferase subunit C
MKLSLGQVKKVATLSNLNLDDSQLEKYSEQLSQILDYIDQLNSVDTDNVKPTFNLTGLLNVMREDTVKLSLTQPEALQNTDSKTNGLFITKGVFNNE